ncbi:MAG: hypothetical protein AAF658_07635, partial [Myxococcota bacterium]
AAGNSAESVLAFAIDRDPTLDCSNTGATPWFVVALALLGLRRRRIGLAVILFATSPAHAITTGGAFAGPTQGSGSSVYWNAAALAADSRGTRFHLEGGGSLVDISYTRADAGANGSPFDTVNFQRLSPTLSFSFVAPTREDYLFLVAGGFSPSTSGAGWPGDGPQRFFGTDQTQVTYAIPVGVIWAPSPAVAVSVMAGPSWGSIDTASAFDYGAFANGLLPPSADPFPTESDLLEGQTLLRASGFGYSGTAGIWFSPTRDLQFGFGAVYNSHIQMSGDVELVLPDSIEESTGIALEPDGDLDVELRLPWAVNSEVQYRIRSHQLAVTFDYQRRSRQDVFPADVSQGSPSFINGPRLSVKGSVDDWTLGVRDLWTLNESFELAARVDFDPRAIPDEALSPVNLDFTSLELALGVPHQVSESVALAMTYAYRHLRSVNVTNSLYNPRLPGDSGLNLPSANGLYAPAPVHRLVLGVDWL